MKALPKPMLKAHPVWLVLIMTSLCLPGTAEPLVSPTWGFRIDLPEGYVYTEGDSKNRFSFSLESAPSQGSPISLYSEARADLVVYESGRYPGVEALASDLATRLQSMGERNIFDYRGKEAVILRLDFPGPQGPAVGWGLCIELGKTGSEEPPLLAILAYGPSDRTDLELFHLSILDSLAPTEAEWRSSGPITHFSYPPEGAMEVTLPYLEVTTLIDRTDMEGAKSVVDREFSILTNYSDSPLWQEAWIRFYRSIYRDAYDRLAGPAFTVERALSKELDTVKQGIQKKDETASERAEGDRAFAQEVLKWIQGFEYERDLMGTDFVDLVSAAVEGRGDCDSRALLWAVILNHAHIESSIMVSRDYGHAMGLANLEGPGARFDLGGIKWLVAETTAAVPLGLIGAGSADPANWLGILLE